MRRRTVLAAGGLALSSAGCLDRETIGRDDAWRELVVDPPEGIYVPSKVDSMTTYGTETVAGRTISLAATRPHSFWTLAGDERARADVWDHHAIHLMVTVHDADTGVVVPTTVSTAIHGTDERTLWPMLSQRMGVHYGDNVPLGTDGRYTVSVRIGSTEATIAGGMDERFGQATAAEFEFGFRADEIDSLGRRLIDEDEGRGEAGAVEPMDHGRHEGHDHEHQREHDHRELKSLADPWLGSAAASDLDVAVGLLEGTRDSADHVLAVIPRTRYNRYPVPFTSLSAEFRSGGDTIARAALGERLDTALGHHYATTLGRELLEAADELTIVVDVPPQLSRHEGYETAFFDLDPISMAIDPP
jgi:hypothetical protein